MIINNKWRIRDKIDKYIRNLRNTTILLIIITLIIITEIKLIWNN